MIPRRWHDIKGFSLIKLMVVIMIVGILSAIAVTRYSGTKDRAKIAVATHDLNTMRKALGDYETDNSTYPTGTSDYSTFKAYFANRITLPDSHNFSAFRYQKDDDNDTYLISIRAKDNEATTLVGTPEGIGVVESVD